MNQALSIDRYVLRRARPSGPNHANYTCFLNWPVFALCGASWAVVVIVARGIASALA